MIDLTKTIINEIPCPYCGVVDGYPEHPICDCFYDTADDEDEVLDLDDEEEYLEDDECYDCDDDDDHPLAASFNHLVSTTAGVVLCIAGMLGSMAHSGDGGFLIFVGFLLLL